MRQFLLILAFVFFSEASCGGFYSEPHYDSDYPDMCVYENYIVGRGERVSMKPHCGELVCGWDLSVRGFLCGSIDGPPGCKKVAGDMRLPFPDCCDTIQC